MQKKEFTKKGGAVIALDIGTTKVCVLAGRFNKYEKLEILAESTVTSDGVLRGVIANIDKMVRAIGDAIAKCERKLGEEIHTVHVGIAGKHIDSRQKHGMLTRDDTHTEICKADVEKLITDIYKMVLNPGEKILHVVPQEFIIDGEEGITDPIGMSGIHLEADFHIVTGQKAAFNNIERCIKRCSLELGSLTLEPLASAEAILSIEEKEAGVALVDIGGGTTDITIYKEGILRHTAVIPFGGDVITRDIQGGCNVMKTQAEKLKVQFGNALAIEASDNTYIAITDLKGRDSKEISEKNLSRIIQARVEEIFDFIVFEIEKVNLDNKLIAGIVLTGGGSLLSNIEDLAALCTGYNTRIGYPVEELAQGYPVKLHSPIYSTSIGLLLMSLKEQREMELEALDASEAAEALAELEQDVEFEEDVTTDEEKKPGFMNTFFNGAKKFFAEKDDTEF